MAKNKTSTRVSVEWSVSVDETGPEGRVIATHRIVGKADSASQAAILSRHAADALLGRDEPFDADNPKTLGS